MHHYITIVKKYFLEDISCDNFLQNNLCEGL